jgi:2-C-methyl-D-erythritol 4-phosphate cytidylyltransferase
VRVAVIIPAAGLSVRYQAAGGLRSKLDEELGGRPVLQRTVELFTKRDEVSQIVVVGPGEDDAAWGEFRDRHGDKLSLLGAEVIRGVGGERSDTVRAALERVREDATHVAVHDAARPATPPELIDRVLEAARSHPAVVPGVEVSDTLKRVGAEAEGGGADPIDAILGGSPKAAGRVVEATVDRSGLVGVQTPQIFERGLLARAYAQDDQSSTDDASLVERLGEPVVVVEGDPRNLKLTSPADLPVLRAIMGVRESSGRATHKRF